ncbi:unnamed protein product [Dibothriocephalus latus]|uniref:Uncharacterized protein n=1 Tax=Dibothriocephalus latus TaxID=60516 RepID=A0A3P7PHJ4_DIBLA|nr:unnamed protein product [Dibothriocephalus latus]
MPLTEMIRAGGGPSTASIGASSATGGSRGTGSSSAAAMATAACVFLSFLASSSSSLVTAPASTYSVPSVPDTSVAGMCLTYYVLLYVFRCFSHQLGHFLCLFAFVLVVGQPLAAATHHLP